MQNNCNQHLRTKSFAVIVTFTEIRCTLITINSPGSTGLDFPMNPSNIYIFFNLFLIICIKLNPIIQCSHRVYPHSSQTRLVRKFMGFDTSFVCFSFSSFVPTFPRGVRKMHSRSEGNNITTKQPRNTQCI